MLLKIKATFFDNDITKKKLTMFFNFLTVS